MPKKKEEELPEEGMVTEVVAVVEEVLPEQKRVMRIAYYSTAAAIVLILLMGWLSSYYVISAQTAQSEATAQTLQQLNARLASVELIVRPRPTPPAVVSFTPPLDAPRLGSPSASVEIVEFSDFQCPFCGKFQQEVYARLKAEYIDTGKASFVYQDFAFLGTESTRAAIAAKCAKEQGKFWEYHDYLFTQQNGENEGGFTDQKLRSYAAALKLNQNSFNSCLQQSKYEASVKAETAAGQALGISGTPTVLVNGTMLVGALPYEQFKAAIDAALQK
ncbi:MAG: DsbA family protein [Candidatus Doudnabacteria bacterium]|nr:DsbA family protein [Candidatus Doudnabacteria bacterium]